jgi:hypothetical protein
MDTLGKKSLSYSTVKNGLLNFRGAESALEIMSGTGGKKRPTPINQPKLCTIWLCATEGKTCEALLEKWV